MSTWTDDGDGWVTLGRRALRTPDPLLVLSAHVARLNVPAREAIGFRLGGHLAVGVKPSGLVRLKPVSADHPEACAVNVDGSFGRLHAWARDRGFRPGHYEITMRDGALYVQLERNTDGNE